MKQILLGYRPYDFTDKDGRQVVGVSLFTCGAHEGTTGHETYKLSVRKTPSNIDDFLGVEVDVEFDNRGKVAQITYPQAVQTTQTIEPVSKTVSAGERRSA